MPKVIDTPRRMTRSCALTDVSGRTTAASEPAGATTRSLLKKLATPARKLIKKKVAKGALGLVEAPPAEPKAVTTKKVRVKKAAEKIKAATKVTDGTFQELDLGLLCDVTGSMCSWIERAKKTLKEIIANVVKSCDGKLKVRASFVGYRDHCDTKRFDIIEFTDNIDQVRDFISKVHATGGGDYPEDVVGGLRKCLDLNWLPGSKKQVFHIFDAPCHGRKYCSGGDSYPDGSPEGLELEPLMREFRDRGIAFTCIKLDSGCTKMVEAMKANHPDLQVTDLENASRTKTDAEVTKMFVDTASFILRATLGGKKTSGKDSTKRVAAKALSTPLWDPKKLEVGDFFSCISYLKVDEIDGNKITLKNHHGGSWYVSRDILSRDMWSAKHYDREVKCSMTELSTILDSVRDTIFTVKFRKKTDPKQVEDKLRGLKVADLKKSGNLAKLSKELSEGESCELVCHMADIENLMGRSCVRDLNVPTHWSNHRQVDHRTIEHIIFKNVKYSLGRKPVGQPAEELPLKHDHKLPRWDDKKLAVGDWLSQITYYKVKEIVDKDTVKVATSVNPSKVLTMSRDILEYEMHSSKAFDEKQKVSRTEMVNLLVDAKESVMTIKFHKKVDDTHIKSVLLGIKNQNDLKDAKSLKQLSKEICTGKDVEMVCSLSRTEGKLGRSSIIDLNAPAGMNFR